MNEEQIFHEAIALNPPERVAYLDRVCAGHPALRASVESLLRANAGASGFLSHPEAGLTVDLSAVAERPGSQIGRYKLLQQIGEGGMGTVYMAEQTEPVRRKVALKVIRAGLDSGPVIARFEAERQALALMDHANIARVLDAGTTENGRPYFVMELVHGVPITKYCDDNHLTPRQRLELFLPVCNAIQHAHHKGIIHRDIKPSNVMVTLYDGKPAPKVIDFGVAKATEQRLTDRTLFTQYGALVGTLEYMSPEQAEMSALGVDTRSDIYSLGVLLYELLTGSTPLSRRWMREAAFAEILRVIKEDEPPRPSTRLSDSGEALASISASRHMEPARLTRLVRGELDWIVMKCLEKDRNRRYESANDFAADVRRYLNDEPVHACPPSAGYRLRKFVRRHRPALFLSAGMFVTAVVLAAGGWMYLRAAREADDGRRDSERAQGITDALNKIPLIQAETRRGQHQKAFDLLKEIEPLIPDHPSLPELWEQCSQNCSLATVPPDADVWLRPYDQPDDSWRHVIRTPDRPVVVRVPRGEYLWRATKPGYREVTGLRPPQDTSFTLDPEDSIPREMVRVRKGSPNRPGMDFSNVFHSVELPEFLIDRHEVTNAQYELFVRAGGYETPEHWRDLPFVDGDGKATSWEKVRPLLADRTGRPGPATWRDGTFPPGEEDHPVRGVSWYEAMAFARFAGKSLPSIYHWTQASQVELSVVLAGDEFLSRSNFGPGVRSVRSLADEGMHGTFGTIGNVKEWCFNDTGDGKRFILGGACGEPIYVPLTLDGNHPLRREEFFGFRCVRFVNDEKGPAAAWEKGKSMAWPAPPRREDLLDTATFRLVVRDRFAYDRGAPLDTTSEQTDEGEWHHVTARINTAYRDAKGRPERMTVHLYLPKGFDAGKGHQTVVYFPGGDAQMLPRLRPLREEYGLDAIVRSGRAVLRPVYQGTYERRYASPAADMRAREDRRICLGQDLMRAVDYLQHRGDINMDQLGYYGFSVGAVTSGSLVVLEPRLRAIVFDAGGLTNAPLRKDRPLLEWRHCLPQIQVPVLMLNGQIDPIYPVQKSQEPMFQLLGTPIKEHFIHPNGHHMLPPELKFARTLRWFDQHLGAPAKAPERR